MNTEDNYYNIIKLITESTGFSPLAVFSYGSFVYKNKKPSDLDLIVVMPDEVHTEQSVFKLDDVKWEITFLTAKEFEYRLDSQDISILECVSLKNVKDQFNIFNTFNEEIYNIIMNHEIKDRSILRTSISKKSSNSYVKAKKKLILKDDFCIDTSLKSLWHSIRIIDFGTQIAKTGEINDFSSSNKIYDDILNDYYTFSNYKNADEFWAFLHKKYKVIQNKYMSEFRLYAPKKEKEIL